MNENNPPMMLPNGYVYGYNVRAGGQGLCGGGGVTCGAGPGQSAPRVGACSVCQAGWGQWRKLRTSWQGYLQKVTLVK